MVNSKRKKWVRCIACNQYFNRGKTRLNHCRDPRCKEKAKQIMIREAYLERKDKLIHRIKLGCFFKGYNDCNGKLLLHCEDGTYYYEISGYSNSSIYALNKKDFESTCKKSLITLCQKHFNMVFKVQNEGGSWDDSILYIMDKSTIKAYNEREMK